MVVLDQQHQANRTPSPSNTNQNNNIRFSHIQLYVDLLEDLHVYKSLEAQLEEFSRNNNNHSGSSSVSSSSSLDQTRARWRELDNTTNNDHSSHHTNNHSAVTPFCPQNRDVVRQLLVGLGFRITASNYNTNNNTRSVWIASRDPAGVQILVTATKNDCANDDDDNDPGVRRFFAAHHNRQGIGVLAFAVDNVAAIRERYERLHPTLMVDRTFCGATTTTNAVDDEQENIHHQEHEILEVFAYYRPRSPPLPPDSTSNNNNNGADPIPSALRQADPGTILRFMEIHDDDNNNNSTTNRNHTNQPVAPPPPPIWTVLGLTPCEEVVFDDTSFAAYCDHWVSNVVNRHEFLDTLRDTLGFVPKVDFNAGVVAAGEAQIESTVTGNTTTTTTTTTTTNPTIIAMAKAPETESLPAAALRNQSQVYLPINNALSTVGHVHSFLQELGQGVQHVASRVENLVAFVQRCNEWREITGEGTSDDSIDRSILLL